MEAPTAHRNAPSEHSGVPVGFFSKRPCYGLFSKTLDLQVRFAHPPFAHHHALRRAGVPVGLLAAPNARPSGSLRSPSVCAPNQLFKLLRCSAWLIHDFAPSPMRALVFRSAYSASRNARASAAFAASIKAHRAVSSETLMLQVRFAHPPPAHRTSSSSCSGVPVGFFRKGHAMAFSPKRSTFRFASLALRWAGEAPLSPCCAPSRLAARWCSGRLIGCAKRSTSRFASLTLRWAGEASLPPAPLSPAPGNAETDGRQSPSAGKALFRSTPWISLPLCISPGGLVLPAHAAPTGGKTCSIHSRRNTLAAPGLFLLFYRSFFFSYFS